jgi:hypothetical protein
MVLSTAKVEDFERWRRMFSTKGAEKRKQYGARVRRSFGIRTTTAGYGWFSTGTRRGFGASPPILRWRQSSRRAGCRAAPRWLSWCISTTLSTETSSTEPWRRSLEAAGLRE